jgi:hypothetical protein
VRLSGSPLDHRTRTLRRCAARAPPAGLVTRSVGTGPGRLCGLFLDGPAFGPLQHGLKALTNLGPNSECFRCPRWSDPHIARRCAARPGGHDRSSLSTSYRAASCASAAGPAPDSSRRPVECPVRFRGSSALLARCARRLPSSALEVCALPGMNRRDFLAPEVLETDHTLRIHESRPSFTPPSSSTCSRRLPGANGIPVTTTRRRQDFPCRHRVWERPSR